jgi:hypothetical protein
MSPQPFDLPIWHEMKESTFIPKYWGDDKDDDQSKGSTHG